MNIAELLTNESIIAELDSDSKSEVLRELATVLLPLHRELDLNGLVHVLEERENLGSTGIGDGIAIPHGKLPNIDRMLIAFGRSTRGIEFDSMDGRPAHLFFLLIAPEDSVGVHLKALAKISKLLKDPAFRSALLGAASAEEIHRLITENEEM